jgi:hypothetical protein
MVDGHQALLEWRRMQALRQAVHDAASLPERLSALCAYQGDLSVFVDLHWARIDAAFRRLPSEEVLKKPDPRLSSLQQRAIRLERELKHLQRVLAELAPDLSPT